MDHVAARIAALLLAALWVTPAAAQTSRPSHCIALVEHVPGLEVIWRAGLRDSLPEGTVRLSYIDHSMFLLQTPGGLSVITDYNGALGPEPFTPDVVTMNHAHRSHWTPAPDPAISHVLPGWAAEGEPAAQHLDLGEMLIRTVSTDIRGRFDGSVERNGNSIFIFEVAGLCIGHLGHLHHEPTAAQYAAIGRLDVVMAPVDGGRTLPHADMIRVLRTFRSSIVLPMHATSAAALDAFLAGMATDFLIDIRRERSLEISLRTLPARPTVIVLTPRLLGLDDADR